MRPGWWWWLRQGFFIALGGFFSWFGIQVLVAAYTLKDPFSFVLTFFASNLIILISLTLLFIFCWQVRQVLKKPPPDPDAE
ncbi:MAG: hypothetical protein COT06_09875 [Syntrophobacteraceae bacterium CG07_land_8_20_14_0_80_61_8]|nr:MAG: hypothetical protein COT06_09875 [Syntrophobacteraceae bacterium CG07_land_8_20_14_0_80_61_8]